MNEAVKPATLKPAAAPAPPEHLQALKPLTPDEINTVVATVKADPELGPGVLFENIDLREPTPAEYRAHLEGISCCRARRASTSTILRSTASRQLIVSIADKAIIRRKHFPTARAGFMVEQMLSVEVNARRTIRALSKPAASAASRK